MICNHCKALMTKGVFVADTGPKIKMYYCWRCDRTVRTGMMPIERKFGPYPIKRKGGDKSEP